MAEVLQVVGTIAGVGGISLGIVMLVYRDFIREFLKTKAFRRLSSAQATMLLGSTIILTFAVAVLGIFVGFIVDAGAIPFIALVGILLVFILAVLLIITRGGAERTGGEPSSPRQAAFVRVGDLIDRSDLDEADRELRRSLGAQRNSADFWYWKSRIAFARQNLDVAAAYIDEALKRDARHAGSITLKIKVLLLSPRRADRAKARELAERSYGICDALDVWLKCLTAEGMFGPGVRSNTELDDRCPPPAFRSSDRVE